MSEFMEFKYSDTYICYGCYEAFDFFEYLTFYVKYFTKKEKPINQIYNPNQYLIDYEKITSWF